MLARAPPPSDWVTPGVSSLLGISVSTSVKWEGFPRRPLKSGLALTLHRVVINAVSLCLIQRSFMHGFFAPMVLDEIYTAGQFQWETNPFNLRNEGLFIPEYLSLCLC